MSSVTFKNVNHFSDMPHFRAGMQPYLVDPNNEHTNRPKTDGEDVFEDNRDKEKINEQQIR